VGDTARTHFQEELAKLEEQAMGGLDMVVESLDRALETVLQQDVELASMVIADDDRIDGRYLEVHQGILSLLARQAPVAGDLRIVAALLHIMKNIERMGDQCVNMAKLVPLAGHEPPSDARILADIQQMGEQARQQVVQCRIWCARTTRSTGSTETCFTWRWRSATTPIGASGQCT
jgi:phosphate transport system protein